MEWGLATLGLTLLLVAGVSKRLSTTPLTPAMVVVAVGVLVGPLLLEQGADRYTYAFVPGSVQIPGVVGRRCSRSSRSSSLPSA